jgi:outer membrane protein assembly factor BamB
LVFIERNDPTEPTARRKKMKHAIARSWLVGLFVVLPLIAVVGAPQDGSASKANWPQWRGPLATGEAPEATPPVTWSETSNIKWKVKIPGRGTASPIVWGDRVFIQTAIPTGKSEAAKGADPPAQGGRGGMSVPPSGPYQFVVLCIDRQSGKTVWQQVACEETPHEGHHPDHGFASHSPVTDGEHLYAYFGSRGLYCYDLHGKLKWKKNLGKMQTKARFGEGSSPVLCGDKIVINWDHEGDDFIVALDKATGSERWRQARDEDTSWATPLVVQHNGQTQIVTTATRRIRSYDAATGQQVWEHEGLTPNAIPSPVAADGIVYAMSGFRGNKLFAIRLGKTGDLTGTDAILWTHNRSTPYVPSPLLYQNRLYFFASNNGILSCFDTKTGKALYGPERIEALQGVYASPVAGAGRVYLVGRNGVTVVIRNADKLEILATNRLQERFDASPAVVGNEILLRGQEYLYCIAGN